MRAQRIDQKNNPCWGEGIPCEKKELFCDGEVFFLDCSVECGSIPLGTGPFNGRPQCFCTIEFFAIKEPYSNRPARYADRYLVQNSSRPASASAAMMLAIIFLSSGFMIAPSRPLAIAMIMKVWFMNFLAGRP